MLQVVLCSVAFAQVVEIPDPNLRAAVRQTLNLPDTTPLTQAAMARLTRLDVTGLPIEHLDGLKYAGNLRDLFAGGCNISDITPLAGLVMLQQLSLARNRITDIAPLANLTQLISLDLADNDIADIRPLAGLTLLQALDIRNNPIRDLSPIDGLTLTGFRHDNEPVCDEPPRPLAPRLENRSFPSVFSAWGGVGWSPVLNQPHLSDVEQMALHDLYWCCLHWDHRFHRNGDTWELRGTTELTSMHLIYEENPDMINLGGFAWLDPDLSTYPPDSPYWRRDADGNINLKGLALVDLTHPGVQRDIIQKTVAMANCGLYDGVMWDYWGGFRYSPAEVDGMVAIVKGIRANVRDDFLIIGNTNHETAPATGPYINGLFMETGVPGNAKNPSKELTKLENTLSWAEKNLRTPRVNALEGRAYGDEPLDSPTNLRWMRTITTLALTFSDGYVLYSTDWWEGVHQHWHYWYDFWDADLGRPLGEKEQLYDERPGLYIREFTNGWAVYNHSGSAQIVTLPEEVQSVESVLNHG